MLNRRQFIKGILAISVVPFVAVEEMFAVDELRYVIKQKFRKLSFVYIGDNMPSYMRHFDKDFDGIINGTYSQLYGGTDIGSYSVYKMRDGKIINQIAWYEENQITLLPYQDRDKAEDLIEEYNFRMRG